ncbi:hypothetical protein IscW_ISCW003219 [Ixodes scapularis]|uniref:Integrator complex subunit 10 n=1 Tax=Ixodes scapularis TaxID=6945 RepID=B7P7V6_IXOSC|nr:hypothetical protein IscW_ISCW003219 [Ixodes scapularis]|eukprot:XP_002399839.1 hypothetical protein IscW_ISCW003219 [Ixodes scapularis]
MKLSPEAEAGSPEADLWRQLLSFVGLASHRLHWELADLVSEPGSAGVSDSQWQRLHSLVLSRPNPGVDYPGPQEAEEALASRQKQARGCLGKDMEPPTLTVSKCIPTEAAVVLTQSFLTAIRCWSILQFLKKDLSRLSQQIRMEEWPWFQSFLVESLIYQDLHKEAIAKLYQAAEVTKDPTVKEKVLMQFTKDDLALGHLIVMTQYDWPEEEQLFLKLLEIIKKQGSFCYGLFFNYIITIVNRGPFQN